MNPWPPGTWTSPQASVLARIVRYGGTTALLVTHDVAEAGFLTDRVVVMREYRGGADGGAHRDRSSASFLRIRDRVPARPGVNPVSEEEEVGSWSPGQAFTVAAGARSERPAWCGYSGMLPRAEAGRMVGG